MEDDLYGDLTAGHEERLNAQHDAAIEAANRRASCSETVALEAQRQTAACQAKVEKLLKRSSALERNLSCLFKTAHAHLARKDGHIAALKAHIRALRRGDDEAMDPTMLALIEKPDPPRAAAALVERAALLAEKQQASLAKLAAAAPPPSAEPSTQPPRKACARDLLRAGRPASEVGMSGGQPSSDRAYAPASQRNSSLESRLSPDAAPPSHWQSQCTPPAGLPARDSCAGSALPEHDLRRSANGNAHHARPAIAVPAAQVHICRTPPNSRREGSWGHSGYRCEVPPVQCRKRCASPVDLRDVSKGGEAGSRQPPRRRSRSPNPGHSRPSKKQRSQSPFQRFSVASQSAARSSLRPDRGVRCTPVSEDTRRDNSISRNGVSKEECRAADPHVPSSSIEIGSGARKSPSRPATDGNDAKAMSCIAPSAGDTVASPPQQCAPRKDFPSCRKDTDSIVRLRGSPARQPRTAQHPRSRQSPPDRLPRGQQRSPGAGHARRQDLRVLPAQTQRGPGASQGGTQRSRRGEDWGSPRDLRESVRPAAHRGRDLRPDLQRVSGGVAQHERGGRMEPRRVSRADLKGGMKAMDQQSNASEAQALPSMANSRIAARSRADSDIEDGQV